MKKSRIPYDPEIERIITEIENSWSEPVEIEGEQIVLPLRRQA